MYKTTHTRQMPSAKPLSYSFTVQVLWPITTHRTVVHFVVCNALETDAVQY